VEADEYGRWLVEYVHLNPVRPRRKTEALAAERARELDRFEWSSHRDYAGLRGKAAEWLCLDWLAYWGKKRREAQEAYQEAMRRWFAGEKTSPWEQLRGQLVLGGEGLWKKAKGMIQKKQGMQEARWTKVQTAVVLRKRVRELVASETDDQVKIWARVRLGGERPVDVAREFGYSHQSGVGQVVRRLEEYAQEDTQLRSKLDQLRSHVCSVES